MPVHSVCEPAASERVANRSRAIDALTNEIRRERGEAGHSGMAVQSIVDGVGTFGCRAAYLQLLEEQICKSQRSPEDLEDARALDRLLRRFRSESTRIPQKLGLCPAVASKALGLLQKPNVSCYDVEKIASCDPILAALLLGQANAATQGRSTPICSVAEAVAYLGLETAKRVMLTATAKPLFSSAALRGLWAHSVDVAAVAEQIAARSGAADAGQAFTAGLIHDVGRLAFEMSQDDDFVITRQRIADASDSVCLADVVLTGSDHGVMGAFLLESWGLPSPLCEAVRKHHTPEQSRSPLASILYLAETVCGSTEDWPSAERYYDSLRVTGLASVDWLSSDPRRLGTTLAMAG